MPSVQLKDANGVTQTVNTLPNDGQTTGANSLPVVIASDQSAVPVATQPQSTGGAAMWAADGGNNALLTNTVVQVAAGARSLYGVGIWNSNGADVWVQVFDALAANVTLGTTKPKFSFRIPGGNSTNAGAWEQRFHGESRIAFATAISIACTTTATGNAAPGLGVQANINYQ